MGGHLGAASVPKEPASHKRNTIYINFNLKLSFSFNSVQLSTYHAHWYHQAYDVEHPVAHSGVLEGMLQRLIVTEEAALVRIPKQEEQQDGKANCKTEKRKENWRKLLIRVNDNSKSILRFRLSENLSRNDLSICI